MAIIRDYLVSNFEVSLGFKSSATFSAENFIIRSFAQELSDVNSRDIILDADSSGRKLQTILTSSAKINAAPFLMTPKVLLTYSKKSSGLETLPRIALLDTNLGSDMKSFISIT